ncbi:hypothetical protein [Brevibacillus nitrificans]|uniref:hypothetical protein n=1 Tax=Brevibacillus nitrificans TaxID=651560 RepID=UPI00285AB036|nr:hypothetical protein [Brevibacillus nitrificans]MDR7319671.1 ElaB/YqjD/DUF883 family membrane-anchored ribosome-binding protein/ribosomal protein S17E [Brevibacillus nitrificans]
MADVTFGVKVAPELKEKIDQLIKESDFDTNKEWFTFLLSLYDLHQLKHQEGTKKYASDLEYIEQNLTRIQETIVQMVKKSADETAHHQSEIEKMRSELQTTLEHSKNRVNELEGLLQEANARIAKNIDDYQEIIKQNTILQELTETVKNSLREKEAENADLKDQISNWVSANYAETIQRKSEAYHQLQQEYLNLKHQLELLRIEYEKKLEMEQVKTQLVKEQAEFLMDQFNPHKKVKLESGRKRGRPRKEQSLQSEVGEAILSVEATQLGDNDLEGHAVSSSYLHADVYAEEQSDNDEPKLATE